MVTLRKRGEAQLTIERLFLDFWPDAMRNLLRKENEANVEEDFYFSQKQHHLKFLL